MIKYYMVLFLILCSTRIIPQELTRQQLDKMFNDFMKIRNVNTTLKTGSNKEYIKCGFSQANSVRIHFNSFTLEQQQILKPLFARPILQTSIVSPSGFFRIHYDTTGTNAPKFYTTDDLLHYSVSDLIQIYVDSVAIAADSSYNFEVNYIGFPAPPPDNGAGGDDKYDIYIANLSGLGEYGETDFEFVSSNDKGPSFMLLNSDFTGFPTLGIFAARVTVAHEFNHGIQVGSYIYRDSDAWFHELTSTSMETFVYTSIKDYYNYLSTYFDNPDRSIAENNLGAGDGYDLAIWNIFQRDKFGYGIIKRDWELMPSERAIVAINQAIMEKGSLFSEALNEFGVRVFYTNYRAQYAPSGKKFIEGENYPLISYTTSLTLPPYNTINGTCFPTSNNYIKMIIHLPGDIDTLASIITNSDYNAASANSDSLLNFQYQVSNISFSGSRDVSGKYYTLLTADKHQFWTDAEILNNLLADSGVYNNNITDFAFPSPFRYNNPGHVNIYIPADANSSGIAILSIYSISMTLVYSSESIIESPFGHPVIKWTPRNNNNERLSSGIYIFAVKSGDKVKTGKIVIFNE